MEIANFIGHAFYKKWPREAQVAKIEGAELLANKVSFHYYILMLQLQILPHSVFSFDILNANYSISISHKVTYLKVNFFCFSSQ